MMKFVLLAFIVETMLMSCVMSVDVGSICGPDTEKDLVESIHNARRLASDWLIARRERHYGWPQGNTASAVTSLLLANESLSRGGNSSLEMELTVKQLQLEVLSLISQSERSRPSTGYHHHSTIDRLPYYIMALNVTCQDFTDFHGIDLISRLSEDMKRFNKDKVKNYYQHALGVMAMCSTGHPIKRRFIEDLINGQEQDGCFQRPCATSACSGSSRNLDTTSMVLAALSCASNTEIHREEARIETSIEKAVDCLLDSHQNGSFGNVINNALAAQALLAAELNYSRWDCHATMRSVLGAMHEDGHYGGLAATIHVLPLLAGRHYSHIKELDVECPEEYTENNVPDLPPLSSDESIGILLQVSTDSSNMYYEVHGARGESLLYFMHRELQDSNGAFTFETKTTDWGEYITSINGVYNNDMMGQHWIIERVEGEEVQCLDKGAGDIIPELHEHYVWTHRMCGPAGSDGVEEDINGNENENNGENE